MGFLDKAKKMAEQAQAKLDEAQKQFNAGQQPGSGGGPAVEYDKHGRPIPQAPDASEAVTSVPREAGVAPPHGDPVAGSHAPPAPPVAPTPGVPPTGQGDPLAGAAEAVPSAPPAVEQPAVPPTAPDAAAPSAPPAQPAADAPAEDRNNPSYAPPKLSSGDPLAG